MKQIPVISFLKLVILICLDFVKYIFCRKRRQRKPSSEENDVPLSSVKIILNNDSEEFANWNTWNDKGQCSSSNKLNSIDEQIQLYRQQQLQHLQQQNINCAISEDDDNLGYDLFQDMEPKITRQPKLLIKKNEANLSSNTDSVHVSRMFAYSAVPQRGSELLTWEDEETKGYWDADEKCDNETIQREKLKLEREEREKRAAENMRRKAERDRAKIQFAAKIS